MESLALIHTLRAALESGDLSVLPVRLADTHAADLAGALAEFATDHQWQLLRCFPLSTQAEVFGYLPEDQCRDQFIQRIGCKITAWIS